MELTAERFAKSNFDCIAGILSSKRLKASNASVTLSFCVAMCAML